MSDGLTLEKLKIVERLEFVETHMKVGEENRKTLMTGFTALETSVRSIEATLFGEKGELGIVQQMNAFLKIANGIKWVLTKIFMAICTAIALAVFPKIIGYLSILMQHHTGG